MEVRKGYVDGSGMQGANPKLLAQVKPDDYMEPLPMDRFQELKPGDWFDLGGKGIEINEGAGHTKGSVTVLVPELKILILGDAANGFTFLFDEFSSSVTDLSIK
jgi:glyoxylase-like metal-dependent hydrolase (beta-lactamase superfamily II)